MKKLAALAVVLTMAGCASAPRPQVHLVPTHHAVKPPPTVQPTAPAKPATFKERFQTFSKKHPRWFR